MVQTTAGKHQHAPHGKKFYVGAHALCISSPRCSQRAMLQSAAPATASTPSEASALVQMSQALPAAARALAKAWQLLTTAATIWQQLHKPQPPLAQVPVVELVPAPVLQTPAVQGPSPQAGQAVPLASAFQPGVIPNGIQQQQQSAAGLAPAVVPQLVTPAGPAVVPIPSTSTTTATTAGGGISVVTSTPVNVQNEGEIAWGIGAAPMWGTGSAQVIHLLLQIKLQVYWGITILLPRPQC